MTPTPITLIGAPVEDGTHLPGCRMGPDAYRAAGLAGALRGLGHPVSDAGNLPRPNVPCAAHPNWVIHHLAEVAAWTRAIGAATAEAAETSLPIILGGDHSIAAGSVPALAAHAAQQGKDLFVLWLDAHPDLHLLDTTASGNLHGTPAAYILGREGFDGHYPPLPAGVKPSNFCALGLRSVDPAERAFIAAAGIDAQDVNAHDITAPLTRFLDRVRAAGGHLHVSFDVDFVDPTIAPAVGTPVPGGATFREAQRIMALVHDSGLLTSMDLAELNPLLDARGQTARLMVDLCACAFGRPVLDRPKAA